MWKHRETIVGELSKEKGVGRTRQRPGKDVEKAGYSLLGYGTISINIIQELEKSAKLRLHSEPSQMILKPEQH